MAFAEVWTLKPDSDVFFSDCFRPDEEKLSSISWEKNFKKFEKSQRKGVAVTAMFCLLLFYLFIISQPRQIYLWVENTLQYPETTWTLIKNRKKVCLFLKYCCHCFIVLKTMVCMFYLWLYWFSWLRCFFLFMSQTEQVFLLFNVPLIPRKGISINTGWIVYKISCPSSALCS